MVERLKQGSTNILQVVILFIIVVLILSVLRVNLRGYMDTSSEHAVVSNFELIAGGVENAWSNYIVPPIVTAWDQYVVPFFRGDWLSGLRKKEIERTTLPPG